jgi:hypothetical protein
MKRASVYILIVVLLVTTLCGCQVNKTPTTTAPVTSPTANVVPTNDLNTNDKTKPLEPDVDKGIVEDKNGVIKDGSDGNVNENGNAAGKGGTTTP